MTDERFPEPALFRARRGEPSLRWGVVGTGFIAGFFVDALRRHTAQTVTAVTSREPGRAAAFAAERGIAVASDHVDQLVARADVDAVYVAAPQNAHLDLGLRAIAAGKHVLVEKPLATTPDEARRLVTAARAAGVLLMEAMWSRYHPQTLVIRQLLADGAIGAPRAVYADHGQAIPDDPGHRLRRLDRGGGALLDLGIYPVQLDSLVRGAPHSIHAVGRVTDTGVDGTATLVLDHGTDEPSVLTTTIQTRTPTVASICGTDARLDLAGPFHVGQGFVLHPAEWTRPPRVWRDDSGLRWFDGLAWQINAFAGYAGEGRLESPLHPLDETVQILETIHAARRQIGVPLGALSATPDKERTDRS